MLENLTAAPKSRGRGSVGSAGASAGFVGGCTFFRQLPFDSIALRPFWTCFAQGLSNQVLVLPPEAVYAFLVPRVVLVETNWATRARGRRGGDLEESSGALFADVSRNLVLIHPGFAVFAIRLDRPGAVLKLAHLARIASYLL